MENICKNIRCLRKHYNLTQKEMADILGVSVSSIRRIEKGVLPRCVNSCSIHRLCDHFGISADYILREDMEKDPTL